MIIQYYCYYNSLSILMNGYVYDGVILDIGFGITECEWIVPGTMME